jgi:DNA-binding NtrC family response regulator
LSPHGPRILVVDDDPTSKESLADVIQGEGWEFHVADTIEEARAAVDDVAPEVIVIEPRAEKGRVADLLITLRQNRTWTPVLLYTDDPAYDDQYALEHGASGVIRKSGGPAALREPIAQLLADEETDRPL